MFTSGSPNAGQLQIGIALVLQDRFSNQAREASAQIRRLHQEAKNVTNANLSAAQSLAGTGAAIGAGMSMALYGAVKQGAAFIDMMTFVDAVSKKNGVTMAQLTKQARSLGRDTMFDSRDIASAMKFMAQAGLDTKEIQTNIRGAANLAGATGVSVGEKGGAADILTNVMKVFRMESSELNSNRVADILTKVTTRSKVSLSELNESMIYSGSTISSLGGTLEQTAAFTGVLADAGIRGSMAGTSMANAYRYLARSIGDPKFKGNKALAQLGLGKADFTNAQGNLIDIGTAMSKVNQRTKGMNDIDRFNTLVSIFNVRGERGASNMITSIDRYKSLLAELQNNSQGSAAKIMDMRMATVAGGIDIMVSSLENLVSTFTEKLGPTLFPILKVIGGIFDTISAVMDIPFLGPAISAAVFFGIALVTVRLGLIALTATLRLMFNDSTVSFANMISVMSVGWRKATMSAEQYAAVQAGITAQQSAGMGANAARVFATSAGAQFIHANPKQYAGGVMFSKGKYFQKDPLTGGVKPMSAAAAAATLGGKTAQELGIINSNPASFGSKAGGIAKGVGKFGFNMLGGWWGIGIMAVTMLLPRLINALTDNTDSNKDNTSAVETSNAVERQKQYQASQLNNEQKIIALSAAIDNLALAMKSGGPAAQIIVNVDGKKTIQEMISQHDKNKVINVGAN